MRIEAGRCREVNPTVGEYRIREFRHAVGSHALRRLQIVSLILVGDRLAPARVGLERPAGLLRPAEPGRVPVHSAVRDGYPMGTQAADVQGLGVRASVQASAADRV